MKKIVKNMGNTIKNIVNKIDDLYCNICVEIYFGLRKILLKYDLIEM